MDERHIIEALGETGLSLNEAKSYLALTRLGHATTGQVAARAQIHNSKSHEALQSLANKGLASYRIKGKTKTFHALEPWIITEKFRDKEKQIAGCVAELKRIRVNEPTRQGIFAYEKIEGIKTIFRQFLGEMDKDGEYLVLAGRPLNVKLEGFLLDFQKKRSRKGVKTKIVNSEANFEYAKLREKLRHTKVRYVTENFPASINIYSDYVAIVAAAQEPMGVLIKSEEIAASFRDYFKIIWKNAHA